MGSAAGAGVAVFNADDADLSAELFLGTIIQNIEFFSGRVRDSDCSVFLECFIGLFFEELHLFWIKRSGKVEDDFFFAQVEADIVIAEVFMHKT